MDSKEIIERVVKLETHQETMRQSLEQERIKLDKIEDSLVQIDKKLTSSLSSTLNTLSETLKAAVALQNELHITVLKNSFTIKLIVWCGAAIGTGLVGAVTRLFLA